MTKRSRSSLGALVAALAATGAAAAPASGATLLDQKVTASDAQKRVCHRQLADGAGVVKQRVEVATDSLLRARLTGARGDWDLGLFDAATGRSIGGSAAFGTVELAEAFANAPVVVQACRRSGTGAAPRLSVAAFALPAPSGDRTVAQLVNIPVASREDKRRLQALDLDLTEHGHQGSLEAVLHGAADVAKLRAAGFSYTVEIDDLAKRSAENRAADVAYALRMGRSGLPSGRTGYRQLADFEAEMKALAEGNPTLVEPLVLPNRSLEGRQVQGIEITENVSANDGKPVFAQFGVHHAREWPSGEMPMEFAHDLVEGFGSDERTTRLVKAVRTIIVPVVNVDGYSLSRAAESTDLRATGTADPILQPVFEGTPVDTELNNSPGHLVAVLADSQSPFYAYKRRNCRVKDGEAPAEGACAEPGTSGTTGGSRDLGVDPNRNYGGFWGGPGASHSRTVDTYRGAGPFSEPETQNVKALISERQVTTAITNHTYSDLVLRPPGLQSQGPPPDEPEYKALGDGMAAQNGYVSQKSYELYDTTGTMEDWSYYATGGLGFTFEIGNKEFHPPYQDVVAEYEGKGPFAGRGNREAYFVAMESAASTRRHSVIAGRAKPGTKLTLSKAFTTFTSPVLANANNPASAGEAIGFADALKTTMTVPSSGVVDWHVNPSTRPAVRGSFVPNIAEAPTKTAGPFEGSSLVPGAGARNAATTSEFRFPIAEGDDREAVRVKVAWASKDDDFDIIVYRAQGEGLSEVGKSASAGGSGNTEEVLLPTPIPGEYVVRVTNWSAADPSWTGTAEFFAAGPVQPAPATTESWDLTCPGGSVSKVVVERGERFDAGRLCGVDGPVTGPKVVLSGAVRGSSSSQGGSGSTGSAPGAPGASGTVPGRGPLRFGVILDRARLGTALRRGLRTRATCTASCRLNLALTVDRKTKRRYGLRSTTVARGTTGAFTGSRTFRVRFTRDAQRRLRRAGALTVRIAATARNAEGRTARVSRGMIVRR